MKICAALYVITWGCVICDIFYFPENIVLNKPAFQSSTSSYIQFSSGPSNANDGNFLTDWYNDHTCSHTDKNTQAWWAADLLHDYTVEYVTLTNRLTHGKFNMARKYSNCYEQDKQYDVCHNTQTAEFAYWIEPYLKGRFVGTGEILVMCKWNNPEEHGETKTGAISQHI